MVQLTNLIIMQVTGNNSFNEYNLSIRIFPDGFSLYITDESNSLLSSKHGKINFAELSANELNDVLRAELETETSFATTEIIIETDCYTVIPQSLFNADDYASLLQFQHPTYNLNSDKLLTNEILNHKAIVLYSCSNKLYETIMSIYKDASIQHHLVTYLKTDYNNDCHLQVVNRNGKLDIIAYKNNNLQLAGTYEYKTDEDFLYQLTHVSEQLQLADSTYSVVISGKQIGAALETLLSKYIRNISVN
ncbi:MAG: DUF3822 family protein [Paludibacter sp.]